MQHLSHRDKLLRQVITGALLAPVSVFLLTAGVLLTCSAATWPIGLAVLGLEVVWLGWRVRDPENAEETRRNLLRQRWASLLGRLETLLGQVDREAASTLAAMLSAHERLLTLQREDDVALPATRLQMLSLLEHCVDLVEKRVQLRNYLAGARSEEVQRDVRQLEARLEKTHDPMTRELYQQALDQKRQELETYVRVEEAVNRIDGQLAAVRCTFDNLCSQVVRLQAARSLEDDASSRCILEELDRLSAGVEAVEGSLREILVLRGAS